MTHKDGGFVGFVAEHWWKLLLGAVGIGASWALLNAQVAGKADWRDLFQLQTKVDQKADARVVELIQRDISEMKSIIADMNQRQRQFYCKGQPAWCR